jgi:hypothetical protein
MRVKLLFAFVLTVALALVAGGAFAASGGDPGKPEDAGKSASAPGHDKSDDSKHDESNPDGTYQGKSPSTPDQDGIGADHGIDNNDKTGEGTDGNNGCGNDPDREDDNNGWCGKPPTTPEASPTVTPTTEPEVSPTATETTEVLGRKFTRPGTEVAGTGLARTGIALGVPIAAGLALLTMGLGIRSIRKQPVA